MRALVLGLWLLASNVALAEHHQTDLKEFKLTELKSSMYLLQGQGGNIFVMQDGDGLLVIDDDYANNSRLLNETLTKMGNTEYVINTHWHGDHTGGNQALGLQSVIVAHDNVRKRLASPQQITLFDMKVPAQPEAALPEITYDSSLRLYYGKQSLHIAHFPRGHTDGDSVIFIEPANIVHMGDHYFNGMFPFVDVENGGNVENMTRNVASILQQINQDTLVIPGHGPLSNKQELAAYLEMLSETTQFVKAHLAKGLTLEQIQKMGLPSRWKAWGNGFINEETWIKLITDSLI